MRLTVMIVLCWNADALADTNTKLLLHGTKPIAEGSQWQAAGWVVIPNLSKTLMVAGPRYQQESWWIEAMAGTVVADRQGAFLLDVRASYDRLDPLYIWGNVEYRPDNGYWYLYADMNVRLATIGFLGLETENDLFASQPNDMSYGPRAVIPFGQLTLIGAYQFHSGDNQVWIRSVVSF